MKVQRQSLNAAMALTLATQFAAPCFAEEVCLAGEKGLGAVPLKSTAMVMEAVKNYLLPPDADEDEIAEIANSLVGYGSYVVDTNDGQVYFADSLGVMPVDSLPNGY